MLMQIYSYIVSKLKSNNESMIKKFKTPIMAMEIKLFQKSKCSSLIFHQSSMFYNDTMDPCLLFGQRFINKNSPMFYSNSNGDKNYVI